jgi:3-hydroxy-9,10-secoandrosta-1,3,5(10)-triene-9,17-dione monooxygenase reductase component
MAMLPTGVTVVSAAGPDGPAGATANAVCSLSIDPMLMLACLDRGSRTLLAVQAANRFGISVLHAGQEQIARAFATKAPVADKWAGVPSHQRDGIPAIDDALAFIACDLRDGDRPGDR